MISCCKDNAPFIKFKIDNIQYEALIVLYYISTRELHVYIVVVLNSIIVNAQVFLVSVSRCVHMRCGVLGGCQKARNVVARRDGDGQKHAPHPEHYTLYDNTRA